MDLAQHGSYAVEKETAFFPGLPIMVHGGAKTIQFSQCITTYQNAASVPRSENRLCVPLRMCAVAVSSMLSLPPLCWYSALLLSSFLLSQVFFFLNILLLHSLSLLVCGSPSLSYVSSLCFIFNPATIFMAACYTEGCFMVLALAGMIAREHQRPWVSALLFGWSTLVRANGWIFAGFFVFDAIRATYLTKRVISTSCVRVWIRTALCSIIVGQSYGRALASVESVACCLPVQFTHILDVPRRFIFQLLRTCYFNCIWLSAFVLLMSSLHRCPPTVIRSCRMCIRTFKASIGQ
jgi:hypothetical protein